ncbi:MAG: alpha/beta fold hydrolase [Alphaproteobacteria bacterium]|nr:alpha/beta fold hydrolase [Alphaproteobacteria bacterium]
MRFTVGGDEIFAATGGKPFDPNLPAVVFVHGAGFDHSVWQQQTRYFAHHGFSVLAVDLPAHGLSGGEPITDVPALGDWVAKAIQAAGVKSARLVGHSMGALSVLETAARHPEKVDKLALLGVAAKMPVHLELLDAASANDHKAIELIAGWGHGARAHRGGNIASGIWLIQAGSRLLERARPGLLANDLAASDAYKDAMSAAEKVQCRTLCLLGAQDKMTPVKSAQPLVDALPDAVREILPHAGHMMMVEAPGATLDALVNFMSN